MIKMEDNINGRRPSQAKAMQAQVQDRPKPRLGLDTIISQPVGWLKLEYDVEI